MIDLHSHILPFLDDGSPNMAASVDMAANYVANGFHHVVATPHVLPENIGGQWAASLKRRVAKMNAALRAASIPLTVSAGMEIAIAPELPIMLEAGLLLPLANSRYVLIETPFEWLPTYWEHILFEVAGRGYRVLLAHPERCIQLSRNYHLIDRLIDMDIHLQVNWGSFTGFYGRPALKTARHLAREGYIHCLATDSHDHRNRSADVVRKAAPEINARIGAANLDLLTNGNPGRILANRTLESMSDTPERSQAVASWKRWLFRQD